MSFEQRLINVTFGLASGSAGGSTFSGSGSNTVKLSGLRCSCQIQHAGGAAMPELSFAVYGMPPTMMAQLATLGVRAPVYTHNTVLVEAGTAEDGMNQVYYGNIYNAWADLTNMPDVPFRCQSMGGLVDTITPAAPTTFTGSVSLTTIISALAKQAGAVFESNGVNAQLNNPYLYGAPYKQAQDAAQQAGVGIGIDVTKTPHVWYIYQSGSQRAGATVLINAASGLVGYPGFDVNGIALKTIYNPSIRFLGQVQVETDPNGPAYQANGTWTVYRLNLDLESMVPNGSWFMDIGAYNIGSPPVDQ